MKSKFIIVIVILIFVGLNCNKEKSDFFSTRLKGKWIRTDINSDTIVFGYIENDNWFELKRGFLIEEGYKRPICPCGLYEYEIKGDSIYIHWMASSLLAHQKYYFCIGANEIEIGNFIDTISPIIRFEKIK